MKTYPYSDDLMIFDEESGHYVLTERAAEDNGTKMRERLSRRRSTNAAAVINRTLVRVSDMIYNYIHRGGDDCNKDRLIATVPELRRVIFKAMLEQLEYLLFNGDLSRSVDRDKREIAIDASAQETLNTFIPSIGVPITYTAAY